MSEPIFKTLEMNDTALSDGIVTIVFDDKCIEKVIDAEYDAYLDFQQILDIAKNNGYAEGVILLICEDAFKGYVYKYDNYCDSKWYRVGITCGYA